MHSLTVYYRPDNYPDWNLWKRYEHKFTQIGEASAIGRGGVPTASPGFYPRVSLGKPATDYDPTTKRELRRGFEFQVRFVGRGHAIIDRFRLHGQKLSERSTARIT